VIDERIHVAIRSIGRSGDVRTTEFFPYAWVWVPASEAAAYRKHHERVVAIPDAADGTCARKFNAILDRSPCPWTLILDDDITGIRYWEDGHRHRPTVDQLREFVEAGFVLAWESKCRLWGIMQNADPLAYKIHNPFNLLKPVLGPWQGHLEPTLRYDLTCELREDYDFNLQNFRLYRRVLRFCKWHYEHDHGKKPGGVVSSRTQERELAAFCRLERKWGSQVVEIGGSAGAHRNRDANPMGNILNTRIRVPIAGV